MTSKRAIEGIDDADAGLSQGPGRVEDAPGRVGVGERGHSRGDLGDVLAAVGVRSAAQGPCDDQLAVRITGLIRCDSAVDQRPAGRIGAGVLDPEVEDRDIGHAMTVGTVELMGLQSIAEDLLTRDVHTSSLSPTAD